MTNPATLRTTVGAILASAAAAAVELGNFPLGACDVQCAFECYFSEHPHRAKLGALEADTRAALARLGFAF